MAEIQFRAGENFNINNIGGSGIGFYNSLFGQSISVGSFNQTSYLTDSTGTVQGPQIDNCKYNSSSTVILGSSTSGINLLAAPDYLATLNVRFVHSSPVQLANVKMYGYDRTDKTRAPSGCALYGAYTIHPNTTQTVSGSGSNAWTRMQGSSGIITFPGGGGQSGLYPNGPYTIDSTHDFYVLLSCSPLSVGSKDKLGVFFELEYL